MKYKLSFLDSFRFLDLDILAFNYAQTIFFSKLKLCNSNLLRIVYFISLGERISRIDVINYELYFINFYTRLNIAFY